MKIALATGIHDGRFKRIRRIIRIEPTGEQYESAIQHRIFLVVNNKEIVMLGGGSPAMAPARRQSADSAESV